jgi:hypothetical protein
VLSKIILALADHPYLAGVPVLLVDRPADMDAIGTVPTIIWVPSGDDPVEPWKRSGEKIVEGKRVDRQPWMDEWAEFDVTFRVPLSSTDQMENAGADYLRRLRHSLFNALHYNHGNMMRLERGAPVTDKPNLTWLEYKQTIALRSPVPVLDPVSPPTTTDLTSGIVTKP